MTIYRCEKGDRPDDTPWHRLFGARTGEQSSLTGNFFDGPLPFEMRLLRIERSQRHVYCFWCLVLSASGSTQSLLVNNALRGAGSKLNLTGTEAGSHEIVENHEYKTRTIVL